MRALLTGLLALLSVSAGAQTAREQASESSSQVMAVYGTPDGLNRSGEAVTTDTPMLTVDGHEFNGRVSCEASTEFMRVTILPNATNDIQQFVLALDTNLDGSADRSQVFNGPYAAVCNNGLMSCDAGTFNNCRAFQWSTATGTVDLAPTSAGQLGACYCINNSCGNNLLWVNREKVLSDLTMAIARTASELNPRLSIGKAQQVDEVTMRVYGGRSTCATDSAPEQYFRHPADMPAAGAAEMSNPSSPAYLIANSSVASASAQSVVPCDVRREVPVDEPSRSDIFEVLTRTAGMEIGCGVGCAQFQIGEGTDNMWDGGRCALFEDRQTIDVRRPDRIQSVRLLQALFDDHQQVWTQGTLNWTSTPSWTSATVPRSSCDRKTNFVVPLNTDVTAGYRTAGSVETLVRTAVGGNGEGRVIMELHYDQACSLLPDTITNGCAALEANPECGLRSETVDGVTTVQNYLTTGLSPLPSARTVGSAACALNTGNRQWWNVHREYTCPSQPAAFDMSAAERRSQSINQSIDPNTGTFTDRRELPNGSVVISSERTALFPEDPVEACTLTCRTRRPRPGIEAADGQPTNRLNTTGVAYDFTFRECVDTNVCPAEPGEEIVSPCDCRSNFAQAAAMMQTIRMVKQDMVCTPP